MAHMVQGVSQTTFKPTGLYSLRWFPKLILEDLEKLANSIQQFIIHISTYILVLF